MMEFLFLDLDDTILDFHKAERIALSKTLREFGVEPAEEVLSLYHRINLWHWEQLEKGKLTRDEVQVGRFAALLRELGVSADAVRCTRSYEGNLAVGHYFLPGAEEAVASLSQKYRLFLASNGTASVQAGRLTSANLYRFFETVFISQELGFNKPAKEFFDAGFARIPDFDPKKAVMVGDSLTSDILGGKNAGITTVWVNPERRLPHPEIVPDYEIESLALALRKEIEAALQPFYMGHMCLYVTPECFDDPPKTPEVYNDATACVWRDGTWQLLEDTSNGFLLFVQSKSKEEAAA